MASRSVQCLRKKAPVSLTIPLSKVLQTESCIHKDGKRCVRVMIDVPTIDTLMAEQEQESEPEPEPEQITTHLRRFITDNPAPTTKESVIIPQPTTNQFVVHMCRMTEIVLQLNDMLRETMCDEMRTVRGETQVGGKKVETMIQGVLSKLEYQYTKASSQQPVDFRDIRKPTDTDDILPLFLDSKKTDGKTIILNDSIPKMGMWYLVLFTTHKRVIAFHCNVFRRDPETETILTDYKRSIECHRHLYKKFGDFRAAARMNLSLNLQRYLADTSTNIFY